MGLTLADEHLRYLRTVELEGGGKLSVHIDYLPRLVLRVYLGTCFFADDGKDDSGL